MNNQIAAALIALSTLIVPATSFALDCSQAPTSNTVDVDVSSEVSLYMFLMTSAPYAKSCGTEAEGLRDLLVQLKQDYVSQGQPEEWLLRELDTQISEL